nr:MAG TPA: hypothetical protein [Caudoviricetes sp.]
MQKRKNFNLSRFLCCIIIYRMVYYKCKLIKQKDEVI